MRQWTNHHLFRWWFGVWPAPSHYLNQCWNIINWTHGNKLQWNLNRNLYIFIHENAFETVIRKLAPILSRPQFNASSVTIYWHCNSHTSHVWKTTLQWRHNGRDGVSITSVSIVYSTVCSDADKKNQSSASLAFVRKIHKGQWTGALVFSLTCTKCWASNRDDGDLSRHCTLYDVTVMHTG